MSLYYRAAAAIGYASVLFLLGCMCWAFLISMPYMWPVGLVAAGLFVSYVLLGLDWVRGRKR